MTSALLKRTIVLGLHFRPNVFSSTSKLSGFGGRGGGGRHHHYHHHQQLQLLLRRSYRNESNYVHTCKRHVSKRAKRIASSLESSDEAALASSSSVTNGSKKLEENSSTSTSSQNLASSPPAAAAAATDALLGPAPGDFIQRDPLTISKDDVEVQFSRSGGAGGQNVNKVNTKAEVRLKLENTLSWMPPNVRSALMTSQANRITNSGELVVTSSRHRRQKQNLDDALSKLQSFIDDAVVAVAPKEANPDKEKKMKATLQKAKEKRLDSKKKKTEKKKMRGKVKSWD